MSRLNATETVKNAPMEFSKMKVCSVEGCVCPVKHTDLCGPHYKRRRKYGDPLGGRPMYKTKRGEPLRFLKEIVRVDTEKCIPWPFAKHRGYGVVYFEGKTYPATHIALLLSKGITVPSGMHAAHCPLSCNNPACVNPNHLRVATPAENIRDRQIAGTCNAGTRNGNAKLTDEEVLTIRASNLSEDDLAKIYGVTPSSIYRVRKNGWGHLK